MNERIKELVKQAGGHFSTHILTSYPAQRRESIELWDKNIEKFAELIIQECIAVINSENYREHSEGWNNAIVWADGMIKQHFGVEE